MQRINIKLDPDSPEQSFLLSALTEKNRFQNIKEFMSWFYVRANARHFFVKEIPFDALDQWCFEKETGNLVHASGKFFKIEGIRVQTNFGHIQNWEQPIINQPEIGILGIITKKIEDVNYFLMQAKMEPGNINIIQLSPTVQATRSNYTQVHKGKQPKYLEYFLDRSKSRIMIDQLQTEQTARFLRKRNRNMVVKVDEDIPLYDDFCWLSLGQIKKLLTIDNLVNMDARSVLSCISLINDGLREYYCDFLIRDNEIQLLNQKFTGFKKDLLYSMIEERHSYRSFNELLTWFNEMKTKYKLHVELIPLNKVSHWIRKDKEIVHDSKPFFSVISVFVQAGSREVSSWTQPLLKDTAYGLVGFIVKKINGVLHFLVQAKVEAGNIDIVDMAPTVSCSRVEFIAKQPQKPMFLDIFMNASCKETRYSSIQSEEGGRFYHLQNKYMIVELDESTVFDISENYTWMTHVQIMKFVRNGYFNVEARSLLSCINLL